MRQVWEEQLVKFARVAYSEGKDLSFKVIRRPDFVKWRIFLTDEVANGKEETAEED